MRLSLCVLCVLCVLLVAACRRQTPPAGAAREDAYRANNLGVALLEQFRYPEAAAAFRQALGVDPPLAIAHANLSLALLYSQDLEGAAREANEAARLLPPAPQPSYVLGLIARAENRNEDARRFFERVRQIDSRDVGTSVNVGQIYLQDGKYAEAIAILRAAVADEPYNVTAVYNLGLALTRAGQRNEGQRMLEAAQALRTKGYAVTFGTSYLEQGRYAEAIASTGAEPELVDATRPPATLTPVALGTIAPGTPGPPVGAAPMPSPFGRSFSADDLNTAGVRRLAASLGGGLTLIDFDGDGDLDLFVVWPAGSTGPTGQRLFRNDGQGGWSDVTAASGLGAVAPDTVPIGAVAGDYDNDGAPDLFVLAYGGSRLYHNDGNGRFRDVTAAVRLPP
jgi:Tfp pilus assembly protein PilF